ncbi:NADPH-dependent FMN reductase [Ramlibacter monticola]|uniref:NADPH-dependent FMN reductase n=1 Tax=Ramlibacter monticola TaxID=1926872 RepID=UPI002ED300C7
MCDRIAAWGATARQWARKIASIDALLIVTGEYNHGVPAVLKNALVAASAVSGGFPAGDLAGMWSGIQREPRELDLPMKSAPRGGALLCLLAERAGFEPAEGY